MTAARGAVPARHEVGQEQRGTDPGPAGGSWRSPETAEAAVTLLYDAHALRLVRMAHLMLGDRAGAEDVVQEAFCGLYRRWRNLSDPDKALRYVRSSVINASRSALRRRISRRTQPFADPQTTTRQLPASSAESAVLGAEERDEVMRAPWPAW